MFSSLAARAKSVRLEAVVSGVAIIAWVLMVVAADLVRVPCLGSATADAFSGNEAPDLEIVAASNLPSAGELSERLALFDPTPLFLPSPGGMEREGGADLSAAATADYGPAYKFAETAPTKELIRAAPSGSLQGVAQFLAAPRWFEGMARADEPAAGLAARAREARVDVYRIGEAQRVLSVDILRANGLAGVGWRPLELSVWVTEAGAVGTPITVKGSGVDEVDERIRWIVARELLPTLLLRPGVYRLDVGP